MNIRRQHEQLQSRIKTTNFNKVLFVSCIGLVMVMMLCSSSSYLLRTDAQTTSTAVTTVRLLIVSSDELQPPLLTLNRIENTSRLLFSLGPARLIDGTLLINVDARLYIKPNGSSDYIILAGKTNSEAKLLYESSKSLAEQGLSIVSGDPAILSLISDSNDIIDSYGLVLFNVNESQSNRAQFVAPISIPADTPKPKPVPDPIIIPVINLPLPRTGGSALIGLLIGFGSAAVYLIVVRNTSKKQINHLNT